MWCYSDVGLSLFPPPSRELWRRDAAVSQSIQATKDELHRWEKGLRGTMTKVEWVHPWHWSQ